MTLASGTNAYLAVKLKLPVTEITSANNHDGLQTSLLRCMLLGEASVCGPGGWRAVFAIRKFGGKMVPAVL